MWIAKHLTPPLYTAYMRLVWSTSRVHDRGVGEALGIVRRHDGALALFWHEEVIAAPYCYHRLGFRGHTLVNASDVGEIITRIAERLDYVVFRGGTSSRRSRRRPNVLANMIEHMKEENGVLYGLAVDGSQGPPYRLKRGALVIARECRKPILLARVWFERCVRLPTWDRMAIPLPFNRIYIYARGPYFAPQQARLREMESFRKQLENQLIELAATSYDETHQPRPPGLVVTAPGEACGGSRAPLRATANGHRGARAVARTGDTEPVR